MLQLEKLTLMSEKDGNFPKRSYFQKKITHFLVIFSPSDSDKK